MKHKVYKYINRKNINMIPSDLYWSLDEFFFLNNSLNKDWRSLF